MHLTCLLIDSGQLTKIWLFEFYREEFKRESSEHFQGLRKVIRDVFVSPRPHIHFQRLTKLTDASLEIADGFVFALPLHSVIVFLRLAR